MYDDTYMDSMVAFGLLVKFIVIPLYVIQLFIAVKAGYIVKGTLYSTIQTIALVVSAVSVIFAVFDFALLINSICSNHNKIGFAMNMLFQLIVVVLSVATYWYLLVN